MVGHPDIRMTKQRRVILEELRMFHTHPTADEIYERVRTKLPHVSLGTVYRNLELLSRSGVIRKLEIGGQQMRFDGELNKHQHIRCIRCGRIDDLRGDPLPTECDRDVLASTGYELIERHVEFLGICPACREAGGGGAAE